MNRAFDLTTSLLSTFARFGHGASTGALGPRPERPLELYEFEGCPFCRKVREALCELDIPYRLHNVAKGSPQREAFVARSGKMMVPYLADPNREVAMFESVDIVEYLNRTYAQ